MASNGSCSVRHHWVEAAVAPSQLSPCDRPASSCENSAATSYNQANDCPSSAMGAEPCPRQTVSSSLTSRWPNLWSTLCVYMWGSLGAQCPWCNVWYRPMCTRHLYRAHRSRSLPSQWPIRTMGSVGVCASWSMAGRRSYARTPSPCILQRIRRRAIEPRPWLWHLFPESRANESVWSFPRDDGWLGAQSHTTWPD